MTTVVSAVVAEAAKAHAKFGEFHSTHEGYGVLAEEVAELLEAIRSNSVVAIRDEAVQVAAVALRIAEACERSHGRPDGAKNTAFGTRSGL